MNTENITTTEKIEATISLAYGDEVIDSKGNKSPVMYIDCDVGIVMLGKWGNAFNVPFDVITSDEYKKVIN